MVSSSSREFWNRGIKNSAYDLELDHVGGISTSKQDVAAYVPSFCIYERCLTVSVSHKRMDDTQTTGGNAHTGHSGSVDGGSVDSGDNGGMPVLMNVNSNNAGLGGGSTTGCAASGKGLAGGNASSGDSGHATGGSVQGTGGMMNVDSSEFHGVYVLRER